MTFGSRLSAVFLKTTLRRFQPGQGINQLHTRLAHVQHVRIKLFDVLSNPSDDRASKFEDCESFVELFEAHQHFASRRWFLAEW